jgi:hypothetical protein
MKITIDDTLHITLERDDGQRLEFDLSDAGLAVAADPLIIRTSTTPPELTITVPFQPVTVAALKGGNDGDPTQS